MGQASAVPILMYHHVSPSPGLVTVSPETFHAQMAWLADRGYRSIGLAELAAFLQGQPLPKKSVVISFDDGYLDNYIHAHPVLKAFGFKAVLFLITGWLGDGASRPQGETPDHRQCMALAKAGRAKEMMLNWCEVAEMARAGTFEFHSHTHTHTRWDKTVDDPVQRRALLRQDLEASRTCLQARLGEVSDHLCWPQGYYDDDYVAVARQTGFRYLYTVEKGTVLHNSEPLRLPRIVVKDRAGNWLGSRLGIYSRPYLAAFYVATQNMFKKNTR